MAFMGGPAAPVSAGPSGSPHFAPGSRVTRRVHVGRVWSHDQMHHPSPHDVLLKESTASTLKHLHQPRIDLSIRLWHISSAGHYPFRHHVAGRTSRNAGVGRSYSVNVIHSMILIQD